jgi:hypothetical protein
MKLTKQQADMIKGINDLYPSNSDVNKRLRLTGTALVTAHGIPINKDYYNDFALKEYNFAIEACMLAGVMLMNRLPPLDDRVLDTDSQYEKRCADIINEVVTVLYKELKLLETTPSYNLLYGFISELGSFFQIVSKELS